MLRLSYIDIYLFLRYDETFLHNMSFCFRKALKLSHDLCSMLKFSHVILLLAFKER